MKELAVFLFKSLVAKPDEMSFDCAEEAGAVKLKVKVAAGDRGKIIGKDGRVIKSVRAVLSAAAQKQGKKVFLDVE
ncbi:MAG: KH domain-containing protein [Elusimicrobia bacterium]|nr:KH domain-containing protein [Elusimicrobiota bacterium]